MQRCEEAGAIALVLECVPMQLAEFISEATNNSNDWNWSRTKVDGQVLVYHDLISYGVNRVPKFVKQYTSVQEEIVRGFHNT